MNSTSGPMSWLTPEKAYIFRIVHLDNIPWLLDHGLHCANSAVQDPHFVPIGNTDVISRRATRQIEVSPGGTISDYVAFYFTPSSLMLFNILTGFQVPKKSKDEIVILVSSLHRLASRGIDFVLTDRNAVLKTAQFSNDIARLDWINWQDLQNRDFRVDPNRPDKKERYMAEVLVYQHLPRESLLGMVGNSASVEDSLKREASVRNLKIRTLTRPSWYFS